MNPRFLLFSLFILNSLIGSAQLVKVEDFTPRRADTLILERNWRTRDRIILAELEFKKGDTVTPENLSVSLKKIWNLQNFASVDYRWDSLPDGRSSLKLIAHDAVTVYPIFGGRMAMNLYGVSLKLGIADHNFLGRNIRVEMRGQISVDEPFFGEIKVTIPRQLLWKNMSISAGARSESELYSNLDKNQFFVSLVNPYHEDYRYTFSPDVETGFLQDKSTPLSGHQIIEGADPDHWVLFSHDFWYLRVSESLGTITHRRHQEEGFNLTGMIGTGIGLYAGTRSFLEGSLRAEYDKLLTPRLQFSAKWAGFYQSSSYEGLWTRFGPGDIRGAVYGHLTGPLMHVVSTGLYYTWLNKDFIAIEQSLFVQYASAMKTVGDWSTLTRHYAIGTGFQFTVPMFPAASFLISFSYNSNRYNWFYLEM